MAQPKIDERRYDDETTAARGISHTTLEANPVVHPETVFETPAAITLDRDLTFDDKLRALANWDRYVRRRMMAASRDADGSERQSDMDLLIAIENARSSLRHAPDQVSENVLHDPQPGNASESEVLTPTEARQGSNRRMNFRILERSLLLAALAAAMLYLWFYFSGQ